jgi:Mn2+/Fe2+ NRAMP family transporter
MSNAIDEREPVGRNRGSLPEGFWKGFGPGLLWAAAAIGVSHLVQSTRAGAVAGFELIGIIVLALILKYPFFEFAPRYAAATGWSLVEGYRRIGSWALWLYFLLTLVSSVIVQAAIVLFTAFLLQQILGVGWSLPIVGAVLMAACAGLLWAGRFRLLDGTIKVVLVVLGISTLVAAAVALPRADFSTAALWPAIGERGIALAFILALAGWMPSAIDISVWNSLWTLAKDRDSGRRASVRVATLDFNIGYVGTSILAFAFLLLGATVMHGAGRDFSPQGTAFSLQLVDLYTETLGSWLRPIVLAAVFTTMFSTSLTVIDGYPRALDRCMQNLKPGSEMPPPDAPATNGYWIALVALALLTLLVLWLFLGNLTTMVDFATIFTFITAPVLGYLNLRAVTSDDVAEADRPGPALIALAYVGLVLLGGTAVVYAVSRLIG